MTLEDRRSLQPTEIEALGAATIEALAGPQARVLRQEGSTVGFEHDLVRLFLAASWLAETRADVRSIVRELEGNAIWRCGPDDQIALWRFAAQLFEPENLAELWLFALESIDRIYLQAALYARACSSNVFPLGLSPVGAQSARRRAGPAIVAAARA